MRTLNAILCPATILVLGSHLLASCSDLKKEWNSPASAVSTVHPEDWGEAGTPDFHGLYLKGKDWKETECTQCHGLTYAGGTSGVSCFPCHDAYPHSVKFTPYHNGYLQQNNFPLKKCQLCHGASYNGGSVVTVGCGQFSFCHYDKNGAPKSPEACNTCHGVFRAPVSDVLSAAPPKSVLGDTLISVSGVGAHQKHLSTGVKGKSVKCVECHTVPAAYNSSGHLNGFPAQVAFNDTLAKLPTAAGKYVPANVQYDHASGNCANTYCHGNWRAIRSTAPTEAQYAYADTAMVGGNFLPRWTSGASQADCGSCHGLPPKGHVADLTGYCGCHDFFKADGSVKDRARHMNGKINLAGGVERAF